MYTITRRHTVFGTRFVVLDAMGSTIKHHRSHESAAWHCFALNSQSATQRTMATITRAANDAQWAGRC